MDNNPTPEPYNADALLAEMRAEARPFTLGGKTFYLAPPTSWPDASLALVGRPAEELGFEEIIEISRGIMGDQYDAFTAAGGSAMLLQALVDKMFGAPMGESSASSPSPNRAARRSKRTSPGSTPPSTSSTSVRNGSATAVRKRS